MPLKNLDKPGISVVICCYNSAGRITPTLEHLSRQINTNFPWEVVIIDNNSNDGTGDAALSLWKKLRCEAPLRVIAEPRPGTMYARRTGIEEAAFRYLLYCDDDNWLNENYLKTAHDIMVSDPNIAITGGMGILELEDKQNAPFWVEQYKNNFGAGPQGKEDGDTTNVKGCLYTAGAILDRVWLDRLFNYGFSSSLKGRDGKSLVAGEDTELSYALRLIGGKLYYSSKMHFRHYMPAKRMNWEYLKKLHGSFGYSDVLISPYADYLNRGKLMPLSKLIIRHLRILKNNYGKASQKSFAEGTVETVNFYRAKGSVKALVTSMNTYIFNKKSVLNLISKKNMTS